MATETGIDPARDYSNQAAVPDFQAYFDQWRADSAKARDSLPRYLDVPYGNGWRQTCDIFLSGTLTENAPVFVFIHGGWWHFLDKSDHSFLAPAFVQSGAVFVAINYPLAPYASIGEIVDSTRMALGWVWRNIARFGGDRDRIHIGGHSAGGHLTAMAAATRPGFGAPPDLVKSATPVSGLFDLPALLDTPHNRSIRMLPTDAVANNPVTHAQNIACPLIVCVGGDETPGFHHQHAAFLQACTGVGVAYTDASIAGRNHFSIIAELGREDSPLFRTVMAAMAG